MVKAICFDLHEVQHFEKQIHVVMAEDHASKTKIKRRKFSQNNKKQAKHTKAVIQPRLPKTASEVSSNWKALSAVSNKYFIE